MVVIVGAGLAGLACATRLEEAGADRILLEASSKPGGRVATETTPGGYRLDTGLLPEFANWSFLKEVSIRKALPSQRVGFHKELLPSRLSANLFLRACLKIRECRARARKVGWQGTCEGESPATRHSLIFRQALTGDQVFFASIESALASGLRTAGELLSRS